MILLREPGASREGALPGYPVNLKREPGLLDPGSELQLTYTLLRPTLEGRFNVRVRFCGLPFRPFRLAGTVLYTVFVVGYLVAVRVRKRRPSTAKRHRQRQHQRRDHQQRNALAHMCGSSFICWSSTTHSHISDSVRKPKRACRLCYRGGSLWRGGLSGKPGTVSYLKPGFPFLALSIFSVLLQILWPPSSSPNFTKKENRPITPPPPAGSEDVCSRL